MKKAILLMSMGGPEKTKDIKPFLLNLFNDKEILKLPKLIRICVSHIIVFLYLPFSKKNYLKIGGKSPLLENTKKQAIELEKQLNLKSKDEYRCFIGMRYWKPFIKDSLFEIKKYNPDEIILLPLYPQFSNFTTRSVLKEAIKYIDIKYKTIKNFHVNNGFINAILENLRNKFEEAKKYGNPIILFSAHGIPEKNKDDDLYIYQCRETVNAILNKMSFSCDAVLCYQSRFGIRKWTKPYIKNEIKYYAKNNRPILIVPISFISEHIETLVELKINYKNKAKKLGAPYCEIIETVGDNKLFISGLVKILTKT